MANIGSSSAPAGETVNEQTRAQRTGYLTNASGDAVGGSFVVPKGNFSTFLGYQMPQASEVDGSKPMSGARVIEIALQREFQELGVGAAKHGHRYANVEPAGERYAGEPGHELAAIKDTRDAWRSGPDRNSLESRVGKLSASVAPYAEQVSKLQETSHNDNVKYLEMQYKFQEISKQHSTISNLMKTRHETIARTIRGSQG